MSFQNPEKFSKFVPPSDRNNFLGTGSKGAYEELLRKKRRSANITAGLLGLGVVCLFAFPHFFVTWKNSQKKVYGYEKGVIKSMASDDFALKNQVPTGNAIEDAEREKAIAILRAKRLELAQMRRAEAEAEAARQANESQ